MTDQLAVDDVDPEPGAETPDTTPPVDSERDAAPTGHGQRISKWDRPPEPHDWRFFVGTLGKVLIATGLLMFGFVAYQLWGTGIETARAQNQLENQFETLIAEFADDAGSAPVASADDVDPGDTGEIGDTTDADDADDLSTADEPGGDDAADAAPAGEPDTAVSSAGGGEVPAAVDLSDQAVEQVIPPIVRGDVLARLEIPRIDRTDFVVPGVALDDLKSGPGHYPDTPLPGQLGNAAIAGHRTTYGAPFFDVDQLGPSDEIIVTMANGDRFVYEVTGVEIVSANAYWVVTTSDPGIAELTLTSCHPKYTARDRIIVHSVLNPAKSSNVGLPTFYELEPDGTPIPGDDPVLEREGESADSPDAADDGPADDGVADDGVADDGVADDGVADNGVADDGVADDGVANDAEAQAGAGDADGAGNVEQAENTDGETTGSTGAELSAVPTGQVEDAFSQGWFHDMSAFPQIALWGSVLTIISLAAYAISRRYRRDSIGFLVGIFPFLVALYFFFQNVNRLLPPGL